MKDKQIPKSHEVWVYLRDGVVVEIKAYRVTGNFKSLDEITTTNITSSIAEHDIKNLTIYLNISVRTFLAVWQRLPIELRN